MSKYADKITNAYRNGHINSYMAERLVKATKLGVGDKLAEDMIQDAQDASDHGVTSDYDYNLYFFTKTCLPDMLKDTFGLDPKRCDQHSLRSYILGHKDDKNYNLKSLVDHRLLVHKWLCEQLDKRAYPNISGKQNKEDEYDIKKWVDTLREIYASIHKKEMSRDAALNHFTVTWDNDERQKFSNWMRYYESGTTEKYNVKNASTDLLKEGFSGIPQAWVNPADRVGDISMTTNRPVQKTDREVRQERASAFKQQIQSRLRALRRLVDKYNEALPHQNMDAIYNEMNTLDRSIGRLNVLASLEDVLVRSANKMQKLGFNEGAEFLHKIAAEPSIIQNLPAAISPQPNLIPGSKPQVHINTIINRLEGVSKLLKSRDTIREVASIDILLNELGIASHFPELTDAQAKLIESFGYASNKIESVVAKLRGSDSSRPSPAQTGQTGTVSKAPIAPKTEKVDTESLRAKPVGEVQRELPKG